MHVNKRLVVHLLVLGLFSLIPLLWLREGQAILGHDAGFPLSPWEHFLDRLFVWTHRFGLGNDQTTEVGGFFIHGFEGVVAALGFSLTNVQRVTFMWYFFGFGVSMYYLASTLFPNRKTYFPLFAGLLYMLNHFVLQAWFIVERTKFTTYIALPILIALLLKLVKKDLSPVQAALLSAITIFFLNGGGFAPLFGAILVALPVVALLSIFQSQERWTTARRILVYVMISIVVGILINGFWVLPYVRYVLTSFSNEFQSAGGTSGIVAWVRAISESASYYNMLRLQGIQEWYVNPHHPYAKVFLENFWFYLASYVPFVMMFGAYLVVQLEEKKRVVLLTLLGLVGLFFMAGSHPPFGELYVWMIRNIPGFSVFRTPYYKFAPVLWLAASILIAYTADTLLKRRVPQRFRMVVAMLAILALCAYNYPFFTGNFFDYEVGRKSTRVQVPDYVFDYARWSNSSEFPYKRLLLLPGQNPDTRFEAYTWKYWSLAQIQGLLDNRSYIGNSLYKTVAEEAFVKNLYAKIEKMDPTWVDEAQYLFVDAVLLRKDFDWQLEASRTIDPSLLEKFLGSDQRFHKVREFGAWSVWELRGTNTAEFSLKDSYYEVHAQDKRQFFSISTLAPVKLDSQTVFVERAIDGLKDRRKGTVYVPICIHCDLAQPRLYEIDRGQIVTPGSIFYARKVRDDERRIAGAKGQQERLEIMGEILTRRFYEVQAQIMRKVDKADLLLGWENVYALLVRYEREVAAYAAGYTPSLETNEFVAIQYENTFENIRNLAANIRDINSGREAEVYFSIRSTWDGVLANLEKMMWYTKNNTLKKYLVDALEASETDVYVQTNTANTFLRPDPKQKPVLAVNETVYGLENGPQENGWKKIGRIALKQGVNKVEFRDSASREYLGDKGTVVLDLGEGDQCVSLPVGELEREQYAFSMEATVNRELSDFYVFVDLAQGKLPLLPYWGRRLDLEEGKTLQVDFIDRFYERGTYVLKFCKLGNKAFSNRTITLRNLTVERISIPMLAFVSKDPTPIPPSNLSVTAKKINQTSYELELTGTGSAILIFDQRFDAGWEISPDSVLGAHTRVHGYANGWRVQKNDAGNSSMTLIYVGQRLYRLGWILSLSTLTVSLTVLLFLRKKK